MLRRLLKKFRHSSDPQRHLSLSVTLAQTYSEMSQYQKGLVIIEDLINKYEGDLSCILDLIIGACDIYLSSNDNRGLIEFVNRVKLQSIIEKSWKGDYNVQAFQIKVREIVAQLLVSEGDISGDTVNRVIKLVNEVNK